jgi:hypothetical protein
MVSLAFRIEPLVPGSGHLSSIAVSSASTIAATPQFSIIVRGAIGYCCADPIPTTPIWETVTYNTDLGNN